MDLSGTASLLDVGQRQNLTRGIETKTIPQDQGDITEVVKAAENEARSNLPPAKHPLGWELGKFEQTKQNRFDS